MAKQKGQPRRNDANRPEEPPGGAALDRYEASMMLMIASRVLEAYDDRDRSRRIDLERRLSKISSPGEGTVDGDGSPE